MAPRTLLAAVAAAVAVAGPLAGGARAGTVFTLTGHGWGHGIGLSQYGTLGFAQHGVRYRDILTHYYTGTRVEPLAAEPTMRVKLLEGAGAVRFATDDPAVLHEEGGAGRDVPLDPGTYRVETGDVAGRVRLVATPGGDVVASALVAPVRIAPGASPLRLDERSDSGSTGAHWRGTLRVEREPGGLMVVNLVRLESYLRGVVPSEVPASWPAAALRAQAVAARSYAYATRNPAAAYDAHADTRSQMYGPIEHEAAATTDAVADTRLEVVWSGATVATTFFSSSSGGRTSSLEASFGSSTGQPYLVPVADPYDAAGGANPNHTWRPATFTPAALASALGLSGTVGSVDVAVDRPSRRALSVVAHRVAGDVVLGASTVQSRLGLRSTWFRLRGLTLRAPARADGGERIRVSGRVWPGRSRRVDLQRRPVGERGWTTIRADLALDAEGRFAVNVRPRQSVDLRLLRTGAVSPVVRVQVGPTLALRAGTGLFSGVTQPPLPGARVALERREPAGWAAHEVTRVDDRGRFRFETVVDAGLWRAAYAGAAGIRPATSADVDVAPVGHRIAP